MLRKTTIFITKWFNLKKSVSKEIVWWKRGWNKRPMRKTIYSSFHSRKIWKYKRWISKWLNFKQNLTKFSRKFLTPRQMTLSKDWERKLTNKKISFQENKKSHYLKVWIRILNMRVSIKTSILTEGTMPLMPHPHRHIWYNNRGYGLKNWEELMKERSNSNKILLRETDRDKNSIKESKTWKEQSKWETLKFSDLVTSIKEVKISTPSSFLMTSKLLKIPLLI